MAATEYAVDGAPLAAYAAPFTVAGAGEHLVDYRSVDRAGNVEPLRRLRLAIAAPEPEPGPAPGGPAAGGAAGGAQGGPAASGSAEGGAPGGPAAAVPSVRIGAPRRARLTARALLRGLPVRAACRPPADVRVRLAVSRAVARRLGTGRRTLARRAAPCGAPRGRRRPARPRGPRARGAAPVPLPLRRDARRACRRPGWDRAGPSPSRVPVTRRIAAFATGRRTRWVVIGAWVLLALALAPLQPRLQDEAANENEAFLAAGAESTRVNDLIDERFALGREVTALVVVTRPGGPLTEADNQRIDADMRALCDGDAIRDLEAIVTPSGVACGELDASLAPETPPAMVSDDGSTALVTVDTTNEDTSVVVANVAALRAQLAGARDNGLRVLVTGEAGFTADASEAFEGIDTTLLAITLVLVLVLLLATYRSPVMALVPVLVVGLAYVIAAGAVYGLVAAGGLEVTGQATAILIVLMFGAGTDYCLLIVSRHREELRGSGDAAAATARAAERTGPAILSAGATVVAAMLVLTLADHRATPGWARCWRSGSR